MHGHDGPEPVRLLPAAWLPWDVLGEIDLVLGQLIALLAQGARWAGRPDQGRATMVPEQLRSVRLELHRQAGGPDEPCLLTKEALLDMAAVMSAVATNLRSSGSAALSLVAIGVESLLLESLIEAQPMTSA